MYLVACVLIVVAQGECVVDMVDHRRVGHACKERVAVAYVRLQRGVGIDVVLRHRQAALVNMLSY